MMFACKRCLETARTQSSSSSVAEVFAGDGISVVVAIRVCCASRCRSKAVIFLIVLARRGESDASDSVEVEEDTQTTGR